MNTVEISQYYDRLVEEHGPTHRAGDANTEASRESRWKVLSAVCDLRGKTVLDVGCGYGYAGRYLAEHNPPLKYTGVDLSSRQIEMGRKEYPYLYLLHGDFCLLHGDVLTMELPQFDVVLSQGPFYLADEAYAVRMVDRMWSLTKEVLAFTGISTWTDVEDDYYRLDPVRWWNHLSARSKRLTMSTSHWRGDVLYALRRGESLIRERITFRPGKTHIVYGPVGHGKDINYMDGVEHFHYGETLCGVGWNAHWGATLTNQEVTCKHCLRMKS